MTRRRTRKARIVTAFVRFPEGLPEGKVRCNGCSKVVGLTPNGHTHAHKTPAGEPCAYRVTYGEPIKLDEIPEIKMRPAAKYAPGRDPAQRRSGYNPESRLEGGSQCEDCGKWLPGERRLCGRCSNARAKARQQKPKSA